MLVAAGTIALQRPNVVADGDFAVDEIALIRSAHFAQLIGNYSRFGWSHLGPAWFYALDFVYAPLGQASWAFFVAAMALHALALFLIVIVAWRVRGPLLAAIASLLLLLFVFKIGLPASRTAWPPYEIILPIVLFLLLAAYGAAGSTLAVVGALLVGSYIGQLHVGTVPTVGITLVVIAAVRLARYRWSVPRPVLADVRGRPLMLALLVVGLVALVAMWVPVAVDQLTGQPGNLTKLARFFFFEHLPHHHFREGLAALGRHLVIFPFGHTPPGAESDYSVLTRTRLLAVAGFLVLSGGLAAAGTVLRDRFAQSLGIILFVVTVGLVWSISRVVGDLYSYFLLWTATLPLVLLVGWAALLIKVAGSTRLSWGAIRTRALAAGLAVVAVALSVVQTVGFLQLRPPAEDFGPGARAATTLVEEALVAQPRQPILVTITGLDGWPVAAGVSLQFIKHGWPVSVRPEYLFMFGEQMRATGRERIEVLVVPDASLGQFDQHAPGLRFLGAVTSCPGCPVYIFTRTPVALP